VPDTRTALVDEGGIPVVVEIIEVVVWGGGGDQRWGVAVEQMHKEMRKQR